LEIEEIGRDWYSCAVLEFPDQYFSGLLRLLLAEFFLAEGRGGRQRFFSAFTLTSAKAKKRAKARRKKSAKKSESAERERKKGRKKKARICAFYATHSGNPVLEPKVTRQGGKARVLNKMFTSVC
jgi:hypothetical protein